MIATNAGGSRAVKYGVIRHYVRGLEVVTASGAILTLGGKLVKSSSGYNLMHLFIGSEGTLGIITKAVLQFRAKPALTRSPSRASRRRSNPFPFFSTGTRSP